MPKVVPIRKTDTACKMLNETFERAERGEIKSLIIITKDNFGVFEVRSIEGTGAMEKAGMCAYAEKIMVDSLIEIIG